MNETYEYDTKIGVTNLYDNNVIVRTDHTICMIPEIKYSKWKCLMFGTRNDGITFSPREGKEPNWFWRKMHYLILGHKWVKYE
jgi:hypothetical protein